MNLRALLRRAPLALLLLCLAACGGGSKLVKRPALGAESILQAPAAAQASDPRLRASLHAVVLRNGPGSWAKNADWDEYYLQVTNLSGAPLQLRSAAVVDSTGTRLAALDDRKQLVRASKATARRYRKDGVKVTAGPGGAALVATGAGVTVLGVGVGMGAAYGSFFGTGAATGATAASGALLLAGPAIAIAGVVRAVRNHQVNEELGRRAPDFPLVLAAGETRALNLFVPLAPSPTRIELDYEAGAGPNQLQLDVREVLAGLHLPATDAGGAAR